MKLCFLAPLGGTGHADRWISYFVGAGHEVHVITTGETTPNCIEGASIHTLKRFGPMARIPNYMINSLSLIIQFRRTIRRIAPDVLHAHQIMDSSLLAAVSGFHPFIVTPWGSDVLITPQHSALSGWIARYVLKKADLVTCSAEYLQQAVVRAGVPQEKTRLVYFGVDVETFKPGAKDEARLREMGAVGCPLIVTARRLDPNCDIASLLAAVPLVLSRFPDAKFAIIGKGSEETRMRELAETLGISHSVRFMGWVPHEDLPQYLCSADIYVSTTLTDGGLAASTAEAMSCGLPVVITDFGDNKKWVQDGVNGFTVPTRSPEALASRILCLLENADARNRFGELNRRIVGERNNWRSQMQRMEQLYRELAAKKAGSAPNRPA